jgi:hypothetical protein
VITPSKGNITKRKDVHSTYNIPPRFKWNNLQNLNNSNDSDFSSPEQSNETKPKQHPPILQTSIPIRGTTKNSHTIIQPQSPSYKDAVLVTNTDLKTPTRFITATTAKNLISSSKVLNNNTNNRQMTTTVPLPHLVPLTQPPPTAISTTSTLTPNTSATNLCNKYLNDKVGQLT